MKYLALICDLDGTLVDSETIHADAWIATLADRGLDFDHQWFRQWIGTSDSYLATDTIQRYHLDATVRELQLDKQQRYYQLVHRQLRPFAGVTDLLRSLYADYPLAIATNSGRQDAEEVFQATQLDKLVHTTVTADDVQHLKPAPDMYLLAAERLGVAPETCIAIEDSPAGSTAAHRAGMYVIGLSNSPLADQLVDVDIQYADSQTALRAAAKLLKEA